MRRLITKSRMGCTIALIVALCISHGPVKASEMPAGWPWHGVNFVSLASKAADLKRYKKLVNMDTVRLHTRPVTLARRNGLSAEEAWDQSLLWLDEMLDECRSLKLRAIVDLSYFPLDPSYHPNPRIKFPQYSPEFWEDSAQLENVVTAVSRLMLRLKGRGDELVAIDIMSEAAVREGPRLVVPSQWAKLMKRVIKVVHAERPDLWVLISPPPMGKVTSYAKFFPFPENHVIYNTHFYLPPHFASQGIGRKPIGQEYPGNIQGERWNEEKLRNVMKPLRDFQKKYNVPVIVGEFSAVRWATGGEQYIKDLAKIFNEYGWGWLYFSASGWHGWNPDYNQNYPGPDGQSAIWRNDYIGVGAPRWQTLRKIFGVK